MSSQSTHHATVDAQEGRVVVGGGAVRVVVGVGVGVVVEVVVG